MTWKSNAVTFVVCDDAQHDGDPMHKIESSWAHDLVTEMRRVGWQVAPLVNRHRCPLCVARRAKAN